MTTVVAKRFRTHPLSFFKGGAVVTVTKQNGHILIYKDVKYVLEYITAVLAKGKGIESIHVNETLAWTMLKPDALFEPVAKPRKLVPIAEYRKAA